MIDTKAIAKRLAKKYSKDTLDRYRYTGIGGKKMTTKPQRKPTHDLSIRLGDKKGLKETLKKIARKNDLSMNRLLIFLIEDWLSKYDASMVTKLL